MRIGKGKPKYSAETCPRATSLKVPYDLAWNPGLSYGTAKQFYERFIISTSYEINIKIVKSRRKHGHVTPMRKIYKKL
jgi:hypothetical protein